MLLFGFVFNLFWICVQSIDVVQSIDAIVLICVQSIDVVECNLVHSVEM